MVVLEIIMIIIGLGAVFVSFKVSDNSKSHEGSGSLDNNGAESYAVKIDEEFDNAFSIYKEKISDIVEENLFFVEERIGSISDERTKGLDDYSKQVIDKIEKNHAEVIFLYDMLNEKENDIKELVHDADLTKADVRDELAKEYQEFKEYIDKVSEIKKSLEVEIIKYKKSVSLGSKADNDTLIDDSDIFGTEVYKKDISDDILSEEILSDDTLSVEALSENILLREDDIKKDISLEDALSNEMPIQNISDEVILEFDSNMNIVNNISESDDKTVIMDNNILGDNSVNNYNTVNETINHNDEIIALYKKGRSILDISKMLGIGQGEVKFVIDMYEAG